MEEKNETHFEKIFWFIVGLCAFGAMLTIFLVVYLPNKVSERIADTALIFWLSTAVSGGIGYLLGSSAPTTKKGNIPHSSIGNSESTIIVQPKEEKK